MPLNFVPPLLNSANPWATTKEDIQALYDCPFTGALTVRTSVLGGFQHDDQIHQYRIFGDNGMSSRSVSPIKFQRNVFLGSWFHNRDAVNQFS